MTEYRTILVPYDFSAYATEAVEVALDLGKRFDAKVHLVHVVQTPIYGAAHLDPAVPIAVPNLRDSLSQALGDVATAAEGRIERPVGARVVEGANVAEAICEAAVELSADLVVMGTHGRSGLAHLLLGSVTERTLRCAPCPVLTVRAHADLEAEAAARGGEDERAVPARAHLETMTGAVERLQESGFDESFLARDGQLVALEGREAFDPEDLVVCEIVRFEGESDPGDAMVLFALRTPDGSVCGTFVAGYGTATDSESAAVVAKLEAKHTRVTRDLERAAPEHAGEGACDGIRVERKGA